MGKLTKIFLGTAMIFGGAYILCKGGKIVTSTFLELVNHAEPDIVVQFF